MKKTDYAIALYTEALQRLEEHPEQIAPDTDFGAAYGSLGILLSAKGRTEEAIEAYSKAIQTGNDHPRVKVDLAVHLYDTRRFEESFKLIEEVLQLPSEEVPADLIQVAKDLHSELLKETNMAEQTEIDSDYQSRVNAQLAEAPQLFLEAFQYLPNDLNQCAMLLENAIPTLKEINPVWTGNALCCYAYCLKELERYDDAIQKAEEGKELGFNLVGAWYYHDAMVYSLNYTDRLLAAQVASGDAITFFRQENSPGNLADHLARKANILKQMAAHISRGQGQMEVAATGERLTIAPASAKSLIIEAIEAICESISIFSTGWEDLREELDAISNIATRVGVRREDLAFLETMPNISTIIEPYLGSHRLARSSSSQSEQRGQQPTTSALDSNQTSRVEDLIEMAAAAVRNGNRHEAIQHYKNALEIAVEGEPEDRALKAFVAYQYGVFLLNVHGRERLDNNSISKIRELWNTTLRLFSTLTEKQLSDFAQRYPPGLWAAKNAIEDDPLMRLEGRRVSPKKSGCFSIFLVLMGLIIAGGFLCGLLIINSLIL